MKANLGAVMLLAATTTAAAQPAMYAPMGPPPPQPQLSESTALWWSLGGTIGAYGLMTIGGVLERNNANGGTAEALGTIGGVGSFLAPSFGHWYADKYWTRGLGLRLGSVGVVLGGLVLALMASECPLFGSGHGSEPCEESSTPGVIAIVAVLAGAGMFIGGTVDDIVQAPKRVRRLNAAAPTPFTLTLAPMRLRESTGLALTGRW